MIERRYMTHHTREWVGRFTPNGELISLWKYDEMKTDYENEMYRYYLDGELMVESSFADMTFEDENHDDDTVW